MRRDVLRESSNRWLVLVVTGLLAAACALLFLPQVLHPSLSPADLRGIADAETRLQLQQAQAKLQNDIRSTLLQAMAGLLVVAGAATTWRQVQTSREGQITERFTRAIDQVGSDKLDIRLGGIYALERIAKNSPADRTTVQFILGAFVRGHAPWAVGTSAGPQHPTPNVDEQLPWLQVRAPDVQAATEVLGRRPDPDPTWTLYLSRVDIRGVQLDGATLIDSQLRHSNLARAWLRGVVLDRSDLTDTDLRRANLAEASLVSVKLAGAYLEGADIRRADLRGADLRGADMRALHLREAVLAGARADARTLWPADFDADERRQNGVVET